MTGFLQQGRPPLILASGSKTRARVLTQAGLTFKALAPDLDEAAMRAAMGDEHSLDPSDVAELLARAKAEAISDLAREAIVIGGDQVLAMKGRLFGKPGSMEEARAQLLDLSGKTHQLHTAIAVAKNAVTLSAHVDVVTLTMRRLSPEFIGRYLAASGAPVLSSVGAYQIEANGIQLFERIDGDFFSILGLPLLPLLDVLRREGAIEG